MNAFLDHADLTGKKVIIVTFQQFHDLRNSAKAHKHLVKRVVERNGNIVNCFALLGGKIGHCAGEDKIQEQINKIFE